MITDAPPIATGLVYDRLCELLREIVDANPDLAAEIRKRCSGLSDGEAVELAATLVARAHTACRTERAHIEASGLRVCARCGEPLPASAFTKVGTGLRPECNECRNRARRSQHANAIGSK